MFFFFVVVVSFSSFFFFFPKLLNDQSLTLRVTKTLGDGEKKG